jgi:hypothetical protein
MPGLASFRPFVTGFEPERIGLMIDKSLRPLHIFLMVWLSTIKEWQTLIVGCVAVAAACVAWLNVSRQIRASTLIAERREKATHQTICAELQELIGLFDLCWRVVDHALASNDAEVRSAGEAIIVAMNPRNDDFERQADFATLAEDLDPIRRQRFADVEIGIRATFRQLAAHDNYANNPGLWLRSLRIQFSHLEIYLRAFDGALADTFNGRTKTPVDHRPTAAHLEPIVAHYENTRPRIGSDLTHDA